MKKNRSTSEENFRRFKISLNKTEKHHFCEIMSFDVPSIAKSLPFPHKNKNRPLRGLTIGVLKLFSLILSRPFH